MVNVIGVLIFSGWFLAIMMTVLFFFLVSKTPAGTWLKAIMGNKKILLTRDKSGSAHFEAVRDEKEFLISNFGPVAKSEDSSFIEDKSKMRIFECFSEIGFTVSEHYAPILNELRDLGINIQKFGQYEKLLKILSDKNKRAKFKKQIIAKYPDKEEEINRVITDEGISIKTNKTYNFHKLADMFPYNVHPGYIQTLINNEVQRILKNEKGLKAMKWAGIGLAVLLVLIGFVIVWQTIGGGDAGTTEVICRAASGGVEQAANKTIRSISS
jgi:hypothetical protein